MSGAATLTPVAPVVTADLERYRKELTGYCAWRLGSVTDADDAVQETLVRAWRSRASFEGRATLRSWLYRIATNVCLDSLGTLGRRPRPVDLRADEGVTLQVLDVAAPTDPADAAAEREAVRSAFEAALRHLPPRQRAVLVLRDVLRWRAAEVASLLDTSVASVNSALQRARTTLRGVAASHAGAALDAGEALDAGDAALLEEYVAAFAAYDVDALVRLLREDAARGSATVRPARS